MTTLHYTDSLASARISSTRNLVQYSNQPRRAIEPLTISQNDCVGKERDEKKMQYADVIKEQAVYRNTSS